MPKLNISDGDIDAILLNIYMGVTTKSNLPKNLYKSTASVLLDGLYKGFGGYINNENKPNNRKFQHSEPQRSIDFGNPDYELLNELRTNVYVFSAAKTYQEFNLLQSLITLDNEKLSYKLFKDKALNEFSTYNEDYLKSEYETALTSAQTAQKYKHITDNIDSFPLMRFSAIGGERECEICGKLHNTTLPSEHPFWHTNTPPRHFNCMCILESIDRYDAPHTSITNPEKIKALEGQAKESVNPIFMSNPAIDKYIFSPKHPYFKVKSQDKKLAENNFNLPIPKKDAN